MRERKSLLNFRPAVIITAGLIFGILIAYLQLFISKRLAIITFSLALVVSLAIGVYFAVKNKKLKCIFCFIMLAVILLGMIVFSVRTKMPKNSVENSTFSCLDTRAEIKE